MCLRIKTDSTATPKALVASEDMIVFKFGYPHKNDFKPYYFYDFTYVRDKESKTVGLKPIRIDVPDSGKWRVEKGYHAYVAEAQLRHAVMNEYADLSFWIISTKYSGKESSVKPGDWIFNNDEDIPAQMKESVEKEMKLQLNMHAGIFKIPKGALYYFGNDGDVVSNRIVYLMPFAEWANDKDHN